MRTLLALAGACSLLGGCGDQGHTDAPVATSSDAASEDTMAGDDRKIEKVSFTEEEWREKLTPEQYRILREDGTERAFTGEHWDTTEPGRYNCAGCGTELFISDDKFISQCGWPAFSAPTDDRTISEHRDTSFGMVRIEVRCTGCDSHLGHVFDDGPGPTGLRYCINSACLDFEGDDSLEPAEPE